MNTSAKGTRAVRELLKALRLLGFRATLNMRSGQRIAPDAKERGIAGDLIAFGANSGYPSLLVECGQRGKNVRAAFEEMRESIADMGGFVPLVARRLKGGAWLLNTSVDDKHSDLAAALVALKGNL